MVGGKVPRSSKIPITDDERDLVEMLAFSPGRRGEVRVSSEPGKGSVFSLFLPLRADPSLDKEVKMGC